MSETRPERSKLASGASAWLIQGTLSSTTVPS